MKYRKKPVVIEAFQWKGSLESAPEWFVNSGNRGPVMRHITFVNIHTLEGIMRADVGDWIIKGVNGEIYPCKPDIFEKTYEEVV